DALQADQGLPVDDRSGAGAAQDRRDRALDNPVAEESRSRGPSQGHPSSRLDVDDGHALGFRGSEKAVVGSDDGEGLAQLGLENQRRGEVNAVEAAQSATLDDLPSTLEHVRAQLPAEKTAPVR